jgi:hypothetical protein
MKKDLIRRSVRCALATVCLGAMVESAAAGSFTRGCAARDMQILMLIEEHESANAVSQQRLTDAMFTMMHARLVCHQGRVVDALALYDTIAQSLTSDPMLSGHMR